MKNNNIHAVAVKAISRKLFSIVLISVMSMVYASAGQTSTVNSKSASLTYIGTTDNEMAFSLRYENPGDGKFSVNVYNSHGKQLFSETYTEKNFSMTFNIPAEAGKVFFSVKDSKTQVTQEFEVTIISRPVDGIAVIKNT